MIYLVAYMMGICLHSVQIADTENMVKIVTKRVDIVSEIQRVILIMGVVLTIEKIDYVNQDGNIDRNVMKSAIMGHLECTATGSAKAIVQGNYHAINQMDCVLMDVHMAGKERNVQNVVRLGDMGKIVKKSVVIVKENSHVTTLPDFVVGYVNLDIRDRNV